MKKTYPTSTKSQQWAKHLRPFGKRMANKSTRKINKGVDDEIARPVAKKVASRQKFAVEYHNGNGKWTIWRKYVYEKGRDRALENLIKKYKNGTFAFLKEYQFRAKNNNPKIN